MSLLQIYKWVCKWKKCENRLTFGEVMGKSLVSCFFWDSVLLTCCRLSPNMFQYLAFFYLQQTEHYFHWVCIWQYYCVCFLDLELLLRQFCCVSFCCQNLSKRALNALTVQASTTELGRLFQMFTLRAEKNAFVSHNKKNDFAIYSGCLWCLLFHWKEDQVILL